MDPGGFRVVRGIHGAGEFPVDEVGLCIDREQAVVGGSLSGEDLICPLADKLFIADQAAGAAPGKEGVVHGSLLIHPVRHPHIFRNGDPDLFVLPALCPLSVGVDGFSVLRHKGVDGFAGVITVDAYDLGQDGNLFSSRLSFFLRLRQFRIHCFQ